MYLILNYTSVKILLLDYNYSINIFLIALWYGFQAFLNSFPLETQPLVIAVVIIYNNILNMQNLSHTDSLNV